MNKKSLATLLSLSLALSTLLIAPAHAQRKGKTSTPAATESSAASYYNGGSRKMVEIASNQVVSAGLFGGALNSGLSISSQSGSSALFGLSAEGNFNLSGPWQISVPMMILASSSTLFSIAAGVQYNFGDGSLLNQFFTNLRPGLVVISGGTSFILNGTIGKRFEIIPGLAYRPNFGMTLVASPGFVTFNLAPIAFSFEL